MTKKKFDFAGWVTKHDIKCSDGITIKHGAFSEMDGKKVPLVWNHNYDTPGNVLGHVLLQSKPEGVYGYGFFNDSDEGQKTKKSVLHGDIEAMSIGARKLTKAGMDVIKGAIYEVSLVLAGANPGAIIDQTSIVHSEEDPDLILEAIVYTDNIIQHFEGETEDDDTTKGQNGDKGELDQVIDELLKHGATDETIGDVIATMDDKQKDAVYSLLGMVANIENNEDGKEGEQMKHNAFQDKNEDIIKHGVLKQGVNDVLKQFANGGVGKLSDALKAFVTENKDVLTHGVNDIEMLFPEADHSTNGNVPLIYKDPNTASEKILSKVHKSPFSRIKTTIIDLTEDEARAKGYIKGNFKKEEFFSLMKRRTGPTTIYKKQKLDRDDVIDITDFSIVAFMNMEMRMMLKEEIARALLIGDGREFDDEDKIDETCIRPILTEHDFFTIKKNFTNAAGFVEAVMLAKKEYRGSGMPDMFIDPSVLISVKLLKGTDGRYLTGSIPSNAELCSIMGLGEIIESSFMEGKGALIVNLRDYSLGSNRGGEITNFEDFDIDFNQHKYLIETRLSGALTLPKSAIHMKPGNSAGTGQTDAQSSMVYGSRQADKVKPPVGNED